MSSRRSSRLKAKEPATFVQPDPTSDDEKDPFDPVDYDYEDADDDNESRPRKRKKSIKKTIQTSKGKMIKGRRGKLAKLPDMPMDLLFEIFGHLKPLDLLNLARTTKALRGVLMSRSSRTIWKQALSSYEDLPECPPDMNEPGYTMLAFDHHCHFCYAPSVSTILWSGRVRACKKCLNEHFTFMYSSDTLLPLQLRDALRTAGYCHVTQLINEVHARGARRFDYYSPRFVTAHLLKFSEEATPLIDDQVKFNAFLEERKKLVSTIFQHATKCERWYDNKRNDRREELQDARSFRKNAIIKNLTEMGWDSELEHLKKTEPYAFNNHALVKQPKELTDRIWTNIKPQLVKWLESKRDERIERERVQRVIARLGILKELLNEYHLQHTGEIFPTIADIFIIPVFEDIINLGADVVVTKETFTPAIAGLPSIVENWRAENLEKLAQLVPPATNSAGKEGKEGERYSMALSVLNLATCVFKCASPGCLDAFPYQRLFHHRCLTSPGIQIGYDGKCLSTEVYFNLGHVPHHFNKPFGGAVFADDWAQMASIFVELNGLDPSTATIAEMDTINARFACQHCSKGGDKKVMNWRGAVNHQFNYHEQGLPRWGKLSTSDEARAKKLEEDFRCTIDLFQIWRCIKCINAASASWGVYGHVNGYLRMLNKPDVIHHLKAVHEIEGAKEGEHYFKDPDRAESYGGLHAVTLKAA